MHRSRSAFPLATARKLRNAAASAVLLSALAAPPVAAADDVLLPRQELVTDLHELVRIIEESHPDPFQRCGGRVVFFRQVTDVQERIPASGLTVEEFLNLVRPIVALVGDGHTGIGLPSDAAASRPRLWLDIEAVDETLWVAGVYREEDRPLLGGRLLLLQGAPIDDVTARMGERQGFDNVYNNLDHVITAIEGGELSDLLGVALASDRLRVEVAQGDGRVRAQDVPYSATQPGRPITPPTAIRLPEPNASDLSWGFLDGAPGAAILRIDSMMRYREAFEIWRSVALAQTLGEHLTETVRRVTGGPVPDTQAARIAAVPSACETFRDLFAAMRKAGARHLIVDLRKNRGGCSDIESMLEFFLYGSEAMIGGDRGYQIRRESALLRKNYGGGQKDPVPEARPGGYDFGGARNWERQRQTGLTADERTRAHAGVLKGGARTATFDRFLREDPERRGLDLDVTVLTSARTYSAGFDMTAMLLRHGATIVGVPSSQASNCFIDSLSFELPHSHLKGWVSFKRSLMFPGSPARGRVLRPDVELTYDALAAMKFDPNASVRLALQHLARESASAATDDGGARLIWSGDLDGALPLLRQRHRLDNVIRGKEVELDQITALRDWVHSRWRHHSWNEPERYDALSVLSDAERGQRFRCVEYSLVLAQVYRAMGWRARFARLQGEGGAHAVTEVFCRQLNKWIMVDGQFAAHVTLDGRPLNLAEIRAARAAQRPLIAVVRDPGKYLDWLSSMRDFIMVSRDCSYGHELEALMVLAPADRGLPREKPRYLRSALYVRAARPEDIYPAE